MPQAAAQPGSWLQPTRVALVLGAVFDAWLMVLLALGVEPPLRRVAYLDQTHVVVALLLVAVAVGGLAVYGVVLNDILDVRHDRVFSPHRPLASGRVGRPQAVVVALGALLVSVGATLWMGIAAAVLWVVVAAAILFFNTVGKFIPSVGLLLLGLIRASVMFMPNVEAGFVWPLWLAMTHVVACSAIAYRLDGKRPRLSGVHIWTLCGGWVFWTLAIIGWMSARDGLLLAGHPRIWLGPAIAAAIFAIIAWRKVADRPTLRRRRREAGEALLRLSLLWLILYDATWLAGAGLWGYALGAGVAFAVAVLLGRPTDAKRNGGPGRTSADHSP